MLSAAEIELVRRAKELVQELEQFLAVRDETAPSGMPADRSDAAWAAHTAGLTRNAVELDTAYAAQFAGRALAQAEAFALVGITPPTASIHAHFATASGPLGVRAVMVALGYMAEKLELRG